MGDARYSASGLTDSPTCFGYCRDCGENHSLPSALAIPHCHNLMEELRRHGRIDYATPSASADPLLSTDCLYTEGRGKMFGILVGEDASGNEVVLRAFSSLYNGARNVPGWAPALVDADKYAATMAEGNLDIHPLTDFIETLPKGSREWHGKVAERRSVCHDVLSNLQALYEVHNFRKEKRTLAGAFQLPKGIPVGTGDCCAPKLLNQAAKLSLRPLALAEFFWGRTPDSGQRVEGGFYPSCAEKCQPILGYMLCGL